MAPNQIFEHGRHLSLVASHPTTPASGKPLRVGQMTGVAAVNESAGGNASGFTSIDFGPAVYDLSVKGVDDAGNVAVAVGDQLFYVDSDIGSGTGFLSKKLSGYFYGFALEAVDSGATDTIRVLLLPSPGPGAADILAGAIGTSELAAAAVTKAKSATFFSAEQTGTGSAQNVAHGLGVAPAGVLVVPTEHPGTPDTGAFDIAEGTHTTTNVVVTVTANVKFKVFAWA